MRLGLLLRNLRRAICRRRLARRINGGEGLQLGGAIEVIAAGKLSIGKSVYIGEDCYFNCLGGVSIGDHSTISRRVTIYSYDHDLRAGDYLPFGPGKICRPVIIGRYVWIGINAAVAPGTTIGDGAVIGMNTVVSGAVEKNAIVVGAKARVVGHRDEKEVARLVEEGRFYTDRYIGE